MKYEKGEEIDLIGKRYPRKVLSRPCSTPLVLTLNNHLCVQALQEEGAC